MAFTYAGQTFDFEFLSDDDLITRYIRKGGTFYELDLLEYLTKMVPSDGTVIDAGAQIGNHAVYFGSHIARHVICVEPNPVVTPILTSNTARHPGSYTIIEAGLGATESHGSLHQPDAGNCGMMQIQVGDGDVRVTTLDAIAPTDVRLVKIDVEGMELDVLIYPSRRLGRVAVHRSHRRFMPSHPPHSPQWNPCAHSSQTAMSLKSSGSSHTPHRPHGMSLPITATIPGAALVGEGGVYR